MNQLVNDMLTLFEGGLGSGFYGHLGRVGKKGGSLPRIAGRTGRTTEVKRIFFPQIKKFRDYINKFWPTGSKDMGTSAISDALGRFGGDRAYGHFTRGKLTGVMNFHEEKGHLYINYFASGTPRKGIGTELMARAAKTASSKGKGLRLISDDESIAFYEKLGMTKLKSGKHSWTANEARNFWRDYERTMRRKV